LVLPPPLDETERGEAAERAVHVDLLHAEAVRDLESVELGGAFAVDAQAFQQHLGIEVEQEPASGSGHDHSNFFVVSSPPRNQ
jgi:hypothetical protein